MVIHMTFYCDPPWWGLPPPTPRQGNKTSTTYSRQDRVLHNSRRSRSGGRIYLVALDIVPKFAANKGFSRNKTYIFVLYRVSVPLEGDMKRQWEIEDAFAEEKGWSVSDQKAVDTWNSTLQVIEGHYALSIPFKVWYLPHHPVLNPKKPEKCRIIFDCAAKYGGSSLNDHVHQGPDLTNGLVGVLLRFRQGVVGFMANIEFMFHQVRVTPEDRDSLRFLWFENNNTSQPLQTLQMTAHIFGRVWSPSCANYALQKVVEEYRNMYSEEVLNTVLRNFYVDDSLKSANSVESAIVLAKQVKKLLNRRGFHLTKYISSSPELLKHIPKEDRGKSLISLQLNLEDQSKERALGMLWHVNTDYLGFDVQVMHDRTKTKRNVLSTRSTVFDPLGYVSPFILQARRIFQQLRRLQKGWDEPLPIKLEEQWGRWLADLPEIKRFNVPRCFNPTALTIKKAQNFIIFQMLLNMGFTIPRLELAGPLEAVRLDKILTKELEIPLEISVYWVDSQIVLWYLNSSDKRFQTYVANRCEEHNWPVQPLFRCSELEEFLELKASPVVCSIKSKADHTCKLLNYYSSWFKMMKAVAWYIRLKHFLKRKSSFGPITVKEFKELSHTGHAGVERVLAEIRRKFWILKGRKFVKSVVYSCVTCKKMFGKTVYQQMANLPRFRVIAYEPPFSRVGVDYFGPFLVKKGHSKMKRYGCIFMCFATRARHIEVAFSFDTDSFIHALERFMARRGEPKEIWSDNSKNFVGAHQELKRGIQEWNQDQIHAHLLKKEIDWKFNPPAASHMGGVWERQIRTIRRVLSSMITQQVLDDEAIITLMTVVEGIINNRPITKLSEDPRDARPLTLDHIMMLRSGPLLPPGQFVEKDQYRRRWKQVQYLADIFWRRWIKEYLSGFQERQKWMKPQRNLENGDLVLIKQDCVPRNQ
ncbi:uncharacterized protein [Penaeus vannamei]|uniref:uncharacterized protein n=1 Tax=Penaeus vannamei TaxID=6689 RepID=UPI00387F874A